MSFLLLNQLAMLQCHLPAIGGSQMPLTIGNSSCRLDSNAAFALSETELDSADIRVLQPWFATPPLIPHVGTSNA